MTKKLQFRNGHFFYHFGLKIKNVICSKIQESIFLLFYGLNGQLQCPNHIHILYWPIRPISPPKIYFYPKKRAKIGPKCPKNVGSNLIFRVLKIFFSRFFFQIRDPQPFVINSSHKPALQSVPVKSYQRRYDIHLSWDNRYIGE